MKLARAAWLVLGGIGVTVSVACSAAPDVPGFDPSSRDDKAGSITGGAKNQNSAARCSDSNTPDLSGCGCSSGATRACHTVKPSVSASGGGGCVSGTQKCVKQGEFSTWGACTGQPTACPSDGGGSDDGSGDSSNTGSTGDGTSPNPSPTPPIPGGGTPPGPPVQQCYPGKVRWCDTPQGCEWGQQACKPDGTWGACNETTLRPGNCGFIFGFPIPTYDQGCCVAAGACCQDYDGADRTKSVGNCGGIAPPDQVVH